MNFLNALLGKVDGINSWTDVANKAGPQFAAWVPQLLEVLSTVLWVLLALVGAAGGIYALYVGIKMARADSAEAKRDLSTLLFQLLLLLF